MKVKIINCSSKDSWYKNRMGEIFEVYKKMHHDKEHYIIKDNPTYLIALKDCELVTKSSPCQNHDLETIKEESKPTKITDNKLFYELDWEFIEGMAQRMFNSKKDKYTRFGWKNGVDRKELDQAITRHLIEIHKDNLDDDNQEYGHYYAIACNAMLAIHELKRKK